MSWGWLGCRGWLRRQGRLGRLGQRLSVLSVLATRFLGGLSQAIGYFIAAAARGGVHKTAKTWDMQAQEGPRHTKSAVLCTPTPNTSPHPGTSTSPHPSTSTSPHPSTSTSPHPSTSTSSHPSTSTSPHLSHTPTHEKSTPYTKLQKPFVFGPDQDRGHRVFAVLCTGAPR